MAMKTDICFKTTQSGWSMTGDVGIMFDDGRIQHLGRKDDCIRMARNALKIYPIEIERHLIGHSNVRMCQVVAITDEQFINEVCLCLVLRPGVKPTEEEILEILKEKLDHDYFPKCFLFFDNFPHGINGKIDHRQPTKMAVNRLKK
ncbi:medium-chain acyl-CoA ligase ACSF2, mitochondrial-like [Ptychodera flava]|uniref:medium-chain acyl-CoA ligase ACSF2, mitochondrial-like n=1 Tax=Ptychodera flava TaxID=63121 RepID=UPI003969CD41